MVPKLNRLLSLVGEKRRVPNDFHMIAANLFPWITSVTWGKIADRPVLEAALFWEYGMGDILDPLNDLRNRMGEDLEYIVFHGANNAVPIFGVLHGLSHSKVRTKTPSIILTDNLVRPWNINNAVKLT